MRVRAAAVLAACAFAVAASTSPPAGADEREKCASSSESAQQLRKAGKLVDARAQLAVCSRAVCPRVVKRDCDRWIGEVESSLPTVVVTARDAKGQDLVDVRVYFDDKLVTEHLDGKSITLDPGPHTMRCEVEGAKPLTTEVVVHEGEKARVLPVQFEGPPGPPPPPSPQGSTSIPVGAYVLGAVGVTSLGLFTVLAITGESTFDSCAQSKTCSPSQKDALGLERGIAWTAFGVGVVSLGVATWLVLSRPGGPMHPSTGAAGVTVDVRPVPGGATGALRLSF